MPDAKQNVIEETSEMTDAVSLLQNTILGILETAPRGLTVERIRTRLFEAGGTVDTHEVVRGLVRLNERRLVEFSRARGWRVCRPGTRVSRNDMEEHVERVRETIGS